MKLGVRVVAFFMTIILVYGVAVIGEYVWYKFELYSINAPKVIEENRYKDEDEKYITEAKELGFSPLVYPDLFSENKSFMEIAEQTEMALLGSLPNEKTYYCNEGYGQVRYLSDRLGFRNKSEIWDSVSKIDGLIVGDSFVQGACVKNKSTISANINNSARLVANLGTASNTPIHYAAILKTFIKEVKPRFVVTVFYPNDNIPNSSIDDIFHSQYFSGDAADKYIIKRGDKLFISQAVIETAMKAKTLALELTKNYKRREFQLVRESQNHFHKHLKLTKSRTFFKTFFSEARSNRQESLDFGSTLAIDTAVEECEKYGCKPIFTYIPNSRFWRPDSRANNYKRKLSSYTAKYGHNLIDTTEEISKLRGDAYAIKGPHLSPKGYKTVAKRITLEIENNLK